MKNSITNSTIEKLCRTARAGFDLSVHAGGVSGKAGGNTGQWVYELEQKARNMQRHYQEVVAALRNEGILLPFMDADLPGRQEEQEALHPGDGFKADKER